LGIPKTKGPDDKIEQQHSDLQWPQPAQPEAGLCEQQQQGFFTTKESDCCGRIITPAIRAMLMKYLTMRL
jgi:hypothetical protein